MVVWAWGSTSRFQACPITQGLDDVKSHVVSPDGLNLGIGIALEKVNCPMLARQAFAGSMAHPGWFWCSFKTHKKKITELQIHYIIIAR